MLEGRKVKNRKFKIELVSVTEHNNDIIKIGYILITMTFIVNTIQQSQYKFSANIT